MPKTAEEYLDTQIAEHPEAEHDGGSNLFFAILNFNDLEPADVNERMKEQIIQLAIPRLYEAYPWASNIEPDEMGINSGGWAMHFKVER